MHINFHTYRTIKRTLAHALHIRRGSHRESHVNTLALLICGIVGSQHVQFAKLVQHMPRSGRKDESLIKRCRRWVQQQDVTYDTFFMPFAQAVLLALAAAPITLILDGSAIGRGCVVLMASVLYRGRAIPIAWLVVKGKKGHLPQQTHCALIQQLHNLLPADAEVTVLGDGEFDGTQLQASIRAAGWHYDCRTASTILVHAQGRTFHVGDLPLRQGEAVAVSEAAVTEERYGPVTVIGVWDMQEQAPLYLVTSLSDADAALARYRLRFRIETLFADHKSRGFHMHKSHLADPTRLTRLLIATSLAYLWVIAVGVFAQVNGWLSRFHRSDRCDLSLFQIGLRAIGYARREGLRVPVQFIPLPDHDTAAGGAHTFSVR
jgi:DDE family transposase